MLHENSLKIDPSIKNWDAEQVYDGYTGATLQTKWLGYEVPDRRVFLGDSLVAVADGFGQFWFQIPCGAFPIKDSCEGYGDAVRVIQVLPGTHVYANFFLTPKETVK